MPLSFKNYIAESVKWVQKWNGDVDAKGKKIYDHETADGEWKIELTGYYQRVGKTRPGKPNHTSWMITQKGKKPEDIVYTSLAKAKKWVNDQYNVNESLEEKATSKSQQRLMGMALAYKRGELDNASDQVKKLAKSMSTKDLEDFAKTKHDNLPEKTTTPQDSDIKDREGSQPKKYHAGLSKATKNARDAHFKKHGKKADDDASAYKPAPGDATAKTKPSKYTKAVNKMMGESLRSDIAKISSRFPERSSVKTKEGKKGVVVSVGRDYVKVAHGNKMKDYRPSQLTREDIEQVDEESKGLAAKAKKSGISVGTLRKVYNRGVAAWKTGHRPGTTPQQWGHARVNAFIVKKKKGGLNHDKDLAEGNARTLSIAQRRQAARRLKRIKTRVKLGRKRALRRTPKLATLKKRAQRQTRSALFKKFSRGQAKKDVSMSRRASIERRINRLSKQRIKTMNVRQVRTARKIDRQRRTSRK